MSVCDRAQRKSSACIKIEGEIIPASVFLDCVSFVRIDVGTFRKCTFRNDGLFGNKTEAFLNGKILENLGDLNLDL